MPPIAFRFALALLTLVSGCALLAISKNPARIAKDPALALYKIPLIPELMYTLVESIFLVCAILNIVPPLLLWTLSDLIQFTFGVIYVYYAYESWRVNGLSNKGHLPLRWIIALTAVNYLIYALRFVFPSFLTTIQIANKSIQGSVMLYAGVCAVIARGRKKDVYPATRAAFWMAFLGLVYVPFVGLADMFTPASKNVLLDRSLSLQLFPIRELIVIVIYTLHLDPLYSRILGGKTQLHEPLSDREREIAALIIEGKSNSAIAEALHISPSTVKTHVRSILRKNGEISREKFILASRKRVV